jgi:hypothetical protein
VSDIETIADSIAIMKSGILVTTGTQPDVIAQVDGKVFETIIDGTALESFRSSQFVVNTIRQKDKTRVRYISDRPAPSSTPYAATLEDAYLFLTKSN